jgi:hypothetical protein
MVIIEIYQYRINLELQYERGPRLQVCSLFESTRYSHHNGSSCNLCSGVNINLPDHVAVAVTPTDEAKYSTNLLVLCRSV